MAERIVTTPKPRLLTDRILSLTDRIQGRDFVYLVAVTGNTDRGVKTAVNKLIKGGKLHNSAGNFSSHPALTV